MSADVPADCPLPAGQLLWKAAGCRECRGTGYSGRIAIFELLLTSSQTRALCMQRADAAAIRDDAMRQGMRTLRQSGWQRVLAGETSLDELVRVCPLENEAD